MRRILLLLLLAGGLFGPSTLAAPRAQCRAPLPPPSREPNIFTAAQETDLGDAVAERFESSLRIIEDDALTANLQRIGGRLVAHLPPTELKIQFRLVDIPDANAFVLPGGRIYVSRKLIGLTRTEDELAGVLGHELGHLVARQVTIAITKQFKEVLNVTSLGDRQDVLAKYNRLMDNAGRKPGVFRGASHEGPDQIEADRLGLFIVAAAGYDARAHAAFFDRFAETEGDTGGFFSRLFGTANPDSKRLGELLKTTSALPAGCTPARRVAGRLVPPMADRGGGRVHDEPHGSVAGPRASDAAHAAARPASDGAVQPGRQVHPGAGRFEHLGARPGAAGRPLPHHDQQRGPGRLHAGLIERRLSPVGPACGALVRRRQGARRRQRSVLEELLPRNRARARWQDGGLRR